jgi:hypothetical protein
MKEVDLFVGLKPGMIKVGAGAAPVVVEGKDGTAVVVEVGVEAGDVAGFVGFAGQAVDAVVVVFPTAPEFVVVGAAWGIGERAEVIVEGVVLLHDHDDVLDFVHITVGESGFWYEQQER